MIECIVECEEVVLSDGRTMILPHTTAPHVHERIVRCRDCRFASEYTGRPIPGYCRKHGKAIWDFIDYCPHGEVAR